jgi:hypothetical protein
MAAPRRKKHLLRKSGKDAFVSRQKWLAMGLPFNSSSVTQKKDHFPVVINRNVLAIKLKSIMNQGMKLAQTWANFNREFYLFKKVAM